MTVSLEQFRARLARAAATLPAISPPDAVPRYDPATVNARLVTTREGRFWLRSETHDPRAPWGETIPEEDFTRAVDSGIRIPFDVVKGRMPLDRCLFIDCETTGLSSGAGTLSFLTAVGQLTDQGFVVDQYFLPEPSDEYACLCRLAGRFAAAQALVTYNGSSFDLPLLEGRFNFWRLDPGFRSLPHLDLLHPTRALFRPRIGDCSLGSVEEQILRFARVEDLPGSEVPEVYFRYLREGQSPRLHAVFEHNRFDIVSLFVYGIWLDARTEPESPTLADPDDLWSLARYWLRRRRTAFALLALDEASQRVLSREQRARVRELRARILKRARSYEAAHGEWEAIAASAGDRPDIVEELAKHLEHRRRDFAGALEIVDRALNALRFRAIIGGDVDAAAHAALLHRRRRLERRLAAQQSARQEPEEVLRRP